LREKNFGKFLVYEPHFRSRYTGKSIKGSIDADFDPVFNQTLSSKNGPLGRHPGPGKDGQNNPKTPLLVTFPPEKLKPKTKHFFYILTTRLAESVEGLNSSLAQSPGEL